MNFLSLTPSDQDLSPSLSDIFQAVQESQNPISKCHSGATTERLIAARCVGNLPVVTLATWQSGLLYPNLRIPLSAPFSNTETLVARYPCEIITSQLRLEEDQPPAKLHGAAPLFITLRWGSSPVELPENLIHHKA